MEVRIGITQVPKELEIDMDDEAGGALSAQIEEMVGSGTGIVWFSDRKGKRVGVPAAKLAYVEIGPVGDSHRVGFGGPSTAPKSKK